jgi:hypothetical protein
MKKKIIVPFYNWIQENYGNNSIEISMRTLTLPNLEEKKYFVQFNSMNFNLMYEFESNPIPF